MDGPRWLKERGVFGRQAEFDRLSRRLDSARVGRGGAVLVTGDPGSGKTVLVDALAALAAENGFELLHGAAVQGHLQPCQAFRRALAGIDGASPFEETDRIRFSRVIAFEDAKIIVERASEAAKAPSPSDISRALDAVRAFLSDAYGKGRTESGRMRVEKTTVIYQTVGKHTLAGVAEGGTHPAMAEDLREAARGMAEEGVEGRKRLVEELTARRYAASGGGEDENVEKARTEIAERVTNLLQARALVTPLLMILEDIHWADESTFKLLAYLSRNARDSPLLVVATMRPGEGLGGADIGRMTAEGTLDEVLLKGIGDGDVASLVQSKFPTEDLPREFFIQITRRCGGNPFFVAVLLDRMVRDGVIVQENGRAVLKGDLKDIPERIGEVISRKLSSLDPEALEVAETLSCMGGEFDLGIALPAGDGSAEAVNRLGASGIVAVSGDRGRFVHALFQETVYSSISQRWKALRHRRLGESYESRHADDPEAAVYEMARHFKLGGDDDKAYRYCIMAAEKAKGEWAVERAAAYYADAVGSLRALPRAAVDEVASVLERMGDAFLHGGEHRKALDAYSEARTGFSTGPDRARACRKMAQSCDQLAEWDAAIRLSEEGRTEQGVGREDFARLLVTEATARWRRSETAEAMELLERGLVEFREAGAAKDVGTTLRLMGNVHLSHGEFDQAAELYKQSYETLEAMGELYWAAPALMNLGSAYLYKGDLRTGLEHTQKALELNERMGDRAGAAMCHTNLGTILFELGELDRAMEEYEKTREWGRRTGDVINEAYATDNLGNVYHNKGELPRAAELHAEGLAMYERAGDRQGVVTALINTAGTYLDMEEYERALEMYGRGIVLAEEIGDRHSYVHFCSGKSEALLGMDKMDEAAEWAARGLAVAREISATIEEGICLRMTAMVKGRRGDTDGALAGFEEALRIQSEGGRKDEIAHNLQMKARTLWAAGRSEEALRNIDEAGRLYAEMGMELWRGRVAETAHRWRGVSRREVE